MCDCNRGGGGVDRHVQMAKNLESIAKSMKEIAESSKATSEVFKKWDANGLPPDFVEMTEVWKQRWSVA